MYIYYTMNSKLSIGCNLFLTGTLTLDNVIRTCPT